MEMLLAVAQSTLSFVDVSVLQPMTSLTRHLILIVIATAFGTLAYIVGLRMIWHEDITGELATVVFASATSLCIAYPLVYLPSFRLLSRRLHGSRPYILFPLLGVVLGVAPVLIVTLRWGGNLTSMLSPESQLFYILFGGVGVVLGGAYPLVDRRYCDRQRIDGHASQSTTNQALNASGRSRRI